MDVNATLFHQKFPKGKLTIKYIHEGKEVHWLFEDLYKVTQQTINIWIAVIQSIKVNFSSSNPQFVLTC